MMTTRIGNSGLAGRTLLAASLLLAAGFVGCKSAPTAQPGAAAADASSNAGDPADANLAPLSNDANAVYSSSGSITEPVRQPARVLGQRSEAQPGQASGETYTPQTQGSNEAYNYNQAPNYNQGTNYNQAAQSEGYASGDYENAGEQALDDSDPNQQAIYADQAPPPLPEYQQPELTEVNDQWTPGYWNYGNGGYFWVPGAWVAPPQTGYLWTPGYWGAYGHRYRFHHGFWGAHIGFYGGIRYGFGYTGYGYQGGYWRGSNFFYNREVNRVNVALVRNVYVHSVTVVNNTYVTNRVSYNGPGGYRDRPRPQELAAYNERRFPAMQNQVANVRAAEGNRQQFFAANQGRPAIAADRQRIAADRTLAQPLRANAFAQQALARQQAQAQQQRQQPGNAQEAQQQQRLGQQQRGVSPQQAGGGRQAAPGQMGAGQVGVGQAQNLRRIPQTRTPDQQRTLQVQQHPGVLSQQLQQRQQQQSPQQQGQQQQGQQQRVQAQQQHALGDQQRAAQRTQQEQQQRNSQQAQQQAQQQAVQQNNQRQQEAQRHQAQQQVVPQRAVPQSHMEQRTVQEPAQPAQQRQQPEPQRAQPQPQRVPPQQVQPQRVQPQVQQPQRQAQPQRPEPQPQQAPRQQPQPQQAPRQQAQPQPQQARPAAQEARPQPAPEPRGEGGGRPRR